MTLIQQYTYVNSKNNLVVIEVQVYPLSQNNKYIVRVFNRYREMCLAVFEQTEEELREHLKKVGCKYE